MNKKLSEDELINRINELAHKQKKDSLTDDEKSEQKKLRQQFLANFRESFKSQIEMMQIYDKNGKEVTPEKVKEIQRKKGLRDD
ncbi:MAG: DUF896 domain-containing protein [Firmicutes bacterium]|uniref:UPF0291 protein IAA89_04190 n=1 Tax=Candidatus Gallilactobacillus intestinavium TaxID=2840838 RepID=A0A9D9E657_9LACO|nr:DUF896 domain-containing protein [Candidatus Gallilactobacillus intestinavium]